jgi:nicotinamide mononucleotide adenylyltransferase
MEVLDVKAEGFVCGRFQPPHNGHLEFIGLAKQRCRFLWIGITQYDIRRLGECGEAPHRSEFGSNPLTYFERVSIITGMLLDAGISRGEFSCLPFPLERAGILADFLPISVPVFTSLCDPWSHHKVERLVEAGYHVEVLFERQEKSVEGKIVRRSIASGATEWESMVPEATRAAVYRLGLRERLLKLEQATDSADA